MTEEFNTAEPSSKFQIDLLLRLGMYSLLSLICFWFPFVTIFRFKDYAERGGCVLYVIFPFMIGVVIYSIILVRRLFLSLKLFTSQRRLIFTILGIVISLPILIIGILLTIYLVIDILGMIIFILSFNSNGIV